MSPLATTLGSRPALRAQFSALLRRGQHLHVLLGGAVQVLAVRVLGAGLAYASMICLARWLGAYDFGVFAYVLVIVTQLGLAFSFGFNSSTLRFATHYLARKKARRLGGFLRHSYAVVLGLSSAAALLSAGLLVLSRDAAGAYFEPLLVGLICVPVWSLLNQLEATARAFGWVQLAYVPGYVMRPSLLILLVGGFVASGGVPNATAALWALTGACVTTAAVQGVVAFRGLRRHVAGVKPLFQRRYWSAVSLSFLAIDGFRVLLDNTDILLIGRLLDPQNVAVYYAVIRSGGFVAFVSFAIVAVAVPRFAHVHTTGTREELQKLVSEVIHLIFWPSLLIAAALAIAGPFVLALFGSSFVLGYPTLLIVLAGLVLRASTLPVEYLLNLTGHHRDTLMVYAGAALASLALNFALIPAFGIAGAAAASYTAMLGGNACLYLLVYKRLKIRAFLLPVPRLR